MPSVAIFRLPFQKHCTLVEQTCGEPDGLISYAKLNGRNGFVIAPFEVTEEQPVVLIRPDKLIQLPMEQLSNDTCPIIPQVSLASVTASDTDNYRLYYSTDFASFHARLLSGEFQKIVLSRCATESRRRDVMPIELYRYACQLYPRLFIALVSTPQTGVWMTATPEILLEGKGDEWRTIALAGTMKLEGEELDGEGEALRWSTKNIQEQRIVATYMAECLEQFTGDFHEEGPRTVRAANLVHLRSDFTFRLNDHTHIGDLLQALHPTPAVCGLPKREAFNFILHNEHTPRRYYSGFMGMLNPDDETHLYVSLRCMNIEEQQNHLYAGGGLLKDSTEELEWLETEAKLETMRRVSDYRHL